MRSTDDEGVWKMDPIPVLNGVDTPFCYLGFEPVLFDAPMRSKTGKDVDWRAQAFLCVCGRGLLDRQVSVVTGLEWGFDIRYEEVEVNGERERSILIKELKSINVKNAWNEKLEELRTRHQGWVFDG